MQLYQVDAALRCDPVDGPGLLVDKQADLDNAGRQLVDNRTGLFRVDATRAFGKKNKP